VTSRISTQHAASPVRRKGWLFVLPWEPTAPGGVNRVVNELAASLAQGSTYDPCILVLDWSARTPSYDRSRSTTVIRLKIRDRGTAWSRQRLLYWLSRPLITLRLRRLLSRMRIAVANAHYPTDQALELLSTMRAIKPGLRTIVSFHSVDATGLSARDAPVRQRWTRELERATAVTSCSLGLQRRLHAALGVTPANSVVRRNGVSRWSQALRRAIPGGTGSTVLSVGAYDVSKAHDVLIEAFSRVAAAHPGLNLRIIGRSGATLAQVAALVRAHGLEQRVTLKADVALGEMGAMYEDTLMFVSASRFESFGISILEAGAAGLPVIATSTDGAREILEPDVDGLVVPTEDAEALARAIATLADSSELRDRLALNLQRKVLRDYQWDAIALTWEALVAGRDEPVARPLDASA
jgi:glycosyltransferase involved in cell wall biosynthesis